MQENKVRHIHGFVTQNIKFCPLKLLHLICHSEVPLDQELKSKSRVNTFFQKIPM